MRREADLTAWGKLYETAGKIKALEPWKDFWDMDLIIVCPKGKKVPYFCSIMGHGGVCCGISVYKGEEGLRDFDMLTMADVGGIPLDYAMYEQNNLTCYWGDREEVGTKQKKIIKELGLKFRGRGQWLFFLSFKKRYTPYLPDAEEVEELTGVYEGLLAILEDYRQSHIPVDYEQGEYLWSIYNKKEKRWKSEIHALPYEPESAISIIELSDEILKKKLQKCPSVEGELQMDFLYLNNSTIENEYDRPINPLLFLVVDGESGMILNVELLDPEDEEIDFILSFFVDFTQQYGRIKTIKARNPLIYSALADICQRCSIELTNGDMTEIDEAIQDLKDHL